MRRSTTTRTRTARRSRSTRDAPSRTPRPTPRTPRRTRWARWCGRSSITMENRTHHVTLEQRKAHDPMPQPAPPFLQARRRRESRPRGLVDLRPVRPVRVPEGRVVLVSHAVAAHGARRPRQDVPYGRQARGEDRRELGVSRQVTRRHCRCHCHYHRHRLTSTTTLGSWPETKGNATRAIHAYTSAPTVELVVNGKSVGARSVRPMVEGRDRTPSGRRCRSRQGRSRGRTRRQGRRGGAPRCTSRGAAVGLPHHRRAARDDGHRRHAPPRWSRRRAAARDARRRRRPPRAARRAQRLVPHRLRCRPRPGRAQRRPAQPRAQRRAVAFSVPRPRPRRRPRHLTAGRDHAALPLAQIDARGPMAAAAAGGGGGGAAAAAEPIIVEATADGFAPARVSIPTSADASAAGVLAAAAAAGRAVDFSAAPTVHRTRRRRPMKVAGSSASRYAQLSAHNCGSVGSSRSRRSARPANPERARGVERGLPRVGSHEPPPTPRSSRDHRRAAPSGRCTCEAGDLLGDLGDLLARRRLEWLQ